MRCELFFFGIVNIHTQKRANRKVSITTHNFNLQRKTTISNFKFRCDCCPGFIGSVCSYNLTTSNFLITIAIQEE